MFHHALLDSLRHNALVHGTYDGLVPHLLLQQLAVGGGASLVVLVRFIGVEGAQLDLLRGQTGKAVLKEPEGLVVKADLAVDHTLQDVLRYFVHGSQPVRVLHVTQHELVQHHPLSPVLGALDGEQLLLPLGDHELVEPLVVLVLVEVEEGLDEVGVHRLGLPLEQALLEVKGDEAPHLLALVVEGLEDAEEEGPPPAHLEVVLLQQVDQGYECGRPHLKQSNYRF